MEKDSFCYFIHLPPELRRLIWKHCLPHRVAEEDSPLFLLDGNDCRQACWTDPFSYQNRQPPAIASVNKESRQVALEQRHKLELDVSTHPDWIWVQPHLDVSLHLNWTRQTPDDYQRYHREDPLYMFFWRAEHLGMQPSIVAETIHPFSIKALLDADEGAEASHIPSFSDQDEQNIDVSDLAFCAEDQNSLDSLDVTMAAVSVHTTRAAGRTSGLFGILGDAPVQVVDIDDKARLREFQTLSGNEPAAQRLFKLFATSRFRTAVEAWKRRAEWIIFANMWYQAKVHEDEILGANPALAWIPEVPEHKCVTMDQHRLNEEHPWVRRAKQRAPQLRPRIMVRYCVNRCYLRERLPEGFGTGD